MSMRRTCGERQIKLFLDRANLTFQPRLTLREQHEHTSTAQVLHYQRPLHCDSHDPSIIYRRLPGAPRVSDLNCNPQDPNHQTANMAPHRTTISTDLPCPQDSISNITKIENLPTPPPHCAPLLQHPLNTLHIHRAQILFSLPPLLRQTRVLPESKRRILQPLQT